MFYSENSVAVAFPFRPLIHFELIFVYSVRQGSSFSLFRVEMLLSQDHLLKDYAFPQWIIWAPLLKISKSVDHGYVSLFVDS